MSVTSRRRSCLWTPRWSEKSRPSLRNSKTRSAHTHSSESVTSMVTAFFPGVAKRFQESADWHRAKYGIEPHFGLFWNLCVNGIFVGQKRVHTKPHIDFKNVVGVCAAFVYEITGPGQSLPFKPALLCLPLLTGKKFNHSKRTWLVLWEAGVIVQLPPWTVFLYPSSLLTHFNIDIHGRSQRCIPQKAPDKASALDIRFVTTEGEERPTPENSTPIEPGDEEGRGTFVYFNEATMYQSSETGFGSLHEARKAKQSVTVNWQEKANEAFARLGTLVPVPHLSS